jgi:hypothetical protein
MAVVDQFHLKVGGRADDQIGIPVAAFAQNGVVHRVGVHLDVVDGDFRMELLETGDYRLHHFPVGRGSDPQTHLFNDRRREDAVLTDGA